MHGAGGLMGPHLQGGLKGFGATFLTMHQMPFGSVALDVGWHTGSGLASPTHKKAIEVSSLRYVCQQSSCRYVCQRSSDQPDTYASDPPIGMCASDLPIASALCDLPIAIVCSCCGIRCSLMQQDGSCQD